MSNPSKQKGTAGETELRLLLREAIPNLQRTPASSIVDLASEGVGRPFRLLATRPDHGQWLVSMPLDEFRELWFAAYQDERHYTPPVHIEVKRYTRFSLHSIFESKFGNKT